MEKQVAIIGAGISGLLACKYTLSKGFCPIVFESSNSIGGVWAKTPEITKLQTPRDLYQFSDFPWPSSADQIPTQNQVLDYVQSYARHFDLLKHIKFNTKVCGLEYEGASEDEMKSWCLWGGTGEPFSSQGKWKVIAEDKQNHSTQTYLVDFAILCIGKFSNVPKIPEFPPNKGPEAFQGKVIHSMDYANMDYESAAKLVKGKQVTVVGFQKFALDIGMECSTANGIANPCTILYRTEHWHLPDLKPWGVPMHNLFIHRFPELFLHKPGEGILLSLLATLLSPLRWAYSKFVETHIIKKVRLDKYGMVPTQSFLKDVSSWAVAVLPEEFYDRVQEGSIILKKSPSGFGFVQEGILVEGEAAPLKTELVILATGFRSEEKLKHMFGSPTFQDYITGPPEATLPLYRKCINARIPQLAVIGFSESISDLFTSEMRCRWVAELLGGTFKVPNIKEMEEDVKKWDKFAQNYAGDNYRRSCITTVHVWYNDLLCKDMGWNPKRKKGLLAELFQPYGPMDYVSP